MRDPKRIDVVLKGIKEYWEKHPDLRLGQILCNFGRRVGMPDPFYLEDEDLLRLLKEEKK